KKLPGRFPVQWVIRPQTDALHDYRGYGGRVTSGSFKVGDKVAALPSGFQSVISHIELNNEPLTEAFEGASVTIRLKDDLDISRGDLLVPVCDFPKISRQIKADICWMDVRPLDTTQTYLLQMNSSLTRVKIQEVLYKV